MHKFRIGQGIDAHRLVEGAGITLGGFFIESKLSLKGHSDADVVLHALTDAILGAIAAEDIGHHFSPSEEKNRNRSSRDFLEFALQAAQKQNYTINNLDITIIAEKPKISPHRDSIRDSIAQLCRIDVTDVSVKATTTEKMGFTGRGEGITASAVVLLVSG